MTILYSDEQIARLQPRPRRYKKGVGKGLTIYVYPNGTKTWFFRYRIAGKQNQIGFGPYPEVSIEKAWEKTLEAREQIRDGIIPMEYKKEMREIMKKTLVATDTIKVVMEDTLKEYDEFNQSVAKLMHHFRDKP